MCTNFVKIVLLTDTWMEMYKAIFELTRLEHLPPGCELALISCVIAGMKKEQT